MNDPDEFAHLSADEIEALADRAMQRKEAEERAAYEEIQSIARSHLRGVILELLKDAPAQDCDSTSDADARKSEPRATIPAVLVFTFVGRSDFCSSIDVDATTGEFDDTRARQECQDFVGSDYSGHYVCLGSPEFDIRRQRFGTSSNRDGSMQKVVDFATFRACHALERRIDSVGWAEFIVDLPQQLARKVQRADVLFRRALSHCAGHKPLLGSLHAFVAAAQEVDEAAERAVTAFAGAEAVRLAKAAAYKDTESRQYNERLLLTSGFERWKSWLRVALGFGDRPRRKQGRRADR